MSSSNIDRLHKVFVAAAVGPDFNPKVTFIYGPEHVRQGLEAVLADVAATPDLVGIGEIAELAGVKPDTVRAWRKRKVLPEPLQVVSGSPVWLLGDITRWLTETGRL